MDTDKKVEEILKKLPPAPAGIEKWIRKELIKKAYIIYNKKEDKAICTHCGRRYKMKRFPKAQHGAQSTCPGCGQKGEFKASGIGRKKLTEQFRVLILTHRGATVYGTLFEIDAEFENFGVPTLYKWLSALYVLTEKEQRYFKRYPGGYWNGERWLEPKEFKLPSPPHGYNWGFWSKYGRTELYEDNLEAVFTKSCLKYHYDKDFFENWEFNAYSYIRYMQQSLKYQSVELLRKAGFERLAVARVDGGGTPCLNLRGTTLQKILKVPKRWHKKVREMDPTQLEFFQKLGEAEKHLQIEIIDLAIQYEYIRKDIEKHVPYMDAASYIYYQNKACDKGQSINLSDYRDYISACETTGEDLTRKKVLFPGDFWPAHDAAMDQKVEQENEDINRNIKKQGVEITGMVKPYKNTKFLIRPAASQTELSKESRGLNHCVKTYGKTMAAGKCAILFIRRIGEPDKPFYTLELSPDKELRQCRGKHNCSMTEEVFAFVDEWLEWIKKKPKKKKKEKEAA